ncbi:kinase-like domain-containing protein [Mycena galericulata]|nr:kinase-like domain-containing protein [Mycena galericulata]
MSDFKKSDPTFGGFMLQTSGRRAMNTVVNAQRGVLRDSAKNPNGKPRVDSSPQYQAANPTKANNPAYSGKKANSTSKGVVAIKIVSSDPDRASPNRYRALDNDLTKDFSILQSINHPHVLEILSVYRSDADRMTSIVLELMPRGTLLDYMLEEYNRQSVDGVLRPPGIEEIPARDIMYQLCQAMSYIHGLGIVHRNLKAENIFLTGDTLPFIKIGGFGLAVRSEGQKLTEVSGSFDYMAPELLSPAKPGYDHRADSWSAGILLFTLLILSTPWIFGAAADEKHLFTLRWEVLGDRLSDEGYEFLRGLLSVEPEQRPSLADALSHRWLAYHRPMYPNVIYPPASEIFVQSGR